MTQDSIGQLKMLCMSVLSLAVAFESEWKRYSSSQSDKKVLVSEYEFSLRVYRRFECDDLPQWNNSAFEPSGKGGLSR